MKTEKETLEFLKELLLKRASQICKKYPNLELDLKTGLLVDKKTKLPIGLQLLTDVLNGMKK